MKLVEHNGKMGIWIRKKGRTFFIEESKLDKNLLSGYMEHKSNYDKASKEKSNYIKQNKKAIMEDNKNFVIGNVSTKAYSWDYQIKNEKSKMNKLEKILKNMVKK